MNITFMIGNGFDLNLGLRTKFVHFYKTYFHSELDREVPESVRNFIQLVLKDQETFGNLDKWSDFEKAFAENVQGSVEDVGEILEDFTIQFAEYLKKEDEKCDYSNEDVLKQFEDFLFLSYNLVENLDKQKISSFYAQKARYSTNNPINDVNFINFNYTSTLHTLLKKVDEKFGARFSEGILENNINQNQKSYRYMLKNIIHIHGTLKNNIIIGVDSIDQFAHEIVGSREELEEFTVKKIMNYNSGQQNKENSFESIIENSDIIYMYGISLGETDKSRWDLINAWIKGTENHKLIYFVFDAKFKAINRIYIPKVIKETKKIKKDVLLKLGFLDNELEKYCDQIFIIDSSDVLNFKLVNEDKEPEANIN